MGERRNDIDAHLDTIFAVARATARALKANTYEADEVAQLTAYKLWRHWEDPKVVALRGIGGSRWRGYIRQTARNTHYDLIRQHQRRLARQLRAEERRTGRPVTTDGGGLVRIAVEDIEAWIARQLLTQEIELLPPQQRRVAARLFLLEMSTREIAAELDLQEQTVRKHARAARETLRLRLAEHQLL